MRNSNLNAWGTTQHNYVRCSRNFNKRCVKKITRHIKDLRSLSIVFKQLTAARQVAATLGGQFDVLNGDIPNHMYRHAPTALRDFPEHFACRYMCFPCSHDVLTQLNCLQTLVSDCTCEVKIRLPYLSLPEGLKCITKLGVRFAHSTPLLLSGTRY